MIVPNSMWGNSVLLLHLILPNVLPDILLALLSQPYLRYMLLDCLKNFFHTMQDLKKQHHMLTQS